MVIDLPEKDIQDYVVKMLYWLHLPDDGTLVDNLQRLIRAAPHRNLPVRISDIDILTSPFFNSMDPETKQRMMKALTGEVPRPRLPYDADNVEAKALHAASLILRKKQPKNKREAKALIKEKEIIRLHQAEGLKPAQIAKIMKVSAEEVYKATKGYNARVKQRFETNLENESRVSNRVPLKMDSVREKVAEYLQESGIYKMKRADLQEHLQGRLADSRVPTLNELSTTLKEDFKIRYIKENPANVRYRDPEIDDRRAWASRILSHMLSEDFLVISVDETHIRSDKNNHYAWQFVANERPFMKVLKQGFENEIIEEVEEDKESEVGDISSEVSELSAKTFKLGERIAGMPKRPRGRPKKEGPALPPQPKRPRGRPRSARSQSQ